MPWSDLRPNGFSRSAPRIAMKDGDAIAASLFPKCEYCQYRSNATRPIRLVAGNLLDIQQQQSRFH
jgi:hypothetical protein